MNLQKYETVFKYLLSLSFKTKKNLQIAPQVLFFFI